MAEKKKRQGPRGEVAAYYAGRLTARLGTPNTPERRRAAIQYWLIRIGYAGKAPTGSEAEAFHLGMTEHYNK